MHVLCKIKYSHSFLGAVPPRPPTSEIQFQDQPLPLANPRSPFEQAFKR